MIPIIEGLIRNGKAYVSNGNVFFDVSSEPTYGEMARPWWLRANAQNRQ
jgi:L-cysteine:1D-myo-inositol 2-amino-2-deoxy-alpha-D-glucopyranoside ligase